MFLVGGPAFSGTTLLTLLLNQGDLVCLDEPDFHNPKQSHRGIPFLKSLYPTKTFPDRPEQPLSYTEAVNLIEACELAIHPHQLGMKTCDQTFISYAEVFKASKHPVVAIVRDIRDALVRPLPPWVNEAQLNLAYRLIWHHRSMFDLWIRYEELVTDTDRIMGQISHALNQRLQAKQHWEAAAVHDPMLKLDRHELLKSGSISSERIGVWKSSGRRFSPDTMETAKLMGY